jgi:hypothetical protein
MSVAEELADALAADVIKAAQDLGDENLISEISKIIGATSTTTQEAFLTAVRVRLSVERARRMLAERVAKGPAEGPRREIGSGPILDAADGGGH